jgi:hypothetical protein
MYSLTHSLALVPYVHIYHTLLRVRVYGGGLSLYIFTHEMGGSGGNNPNRLGQLIVVLLTLLLLAVTIMTWFPSPFRPNLHDIRSSSSSSMGNLDEERLRTSHLIVESPSVRLVDAATNATFIDLHFDLRNDPDIFSFNDEMALGCIESTLNRTHDNNTLYSRDGHYRLVLRYLDHHGEHYVPPVTCMQPMGRWLNQWHAIGDMALFIPYLPSIVDRAAYRSFFNLHSPLFRSPCERALPPGFQSIYCANMSLVDSLAFRVYHGLF